ncbi:MAG TPA: glutathione S-transferase family protein [Amaricoccus sp.]|uniref:glutathione S-transferase family protein n=1 Tax=Amaricoccus sp. TaxID=1872485 RepID=UPI002C9729E6|nr:glutathione S-transferase family protein [Amaricoccus sp.]HPG21846.1 glutathione S-transferase family protein [Amaricoccus sp.]HRW16184.1 glutathione S-transferase family protein [Amaricoccus sp.]
MTETEQPTLHYHPFASFCQKVLIALYEKAVPFRPNLVDLGDPEQRAALQRIWPFGKFPVLEDAGRIVAESSSIIEYLDLRHPQAPRMVPEDPAAALAVRTADRFYDTYVHLPMQKIVTDCIRPEGRTDPQGVEEARATLATAYAMIEAEAGAREWAAGDRFGMADCAAAPALFYANWVQPLMPEYPAAAAYLARLRARPSVARVVEEARPYRHLFPAERRA